ncbi:hypothetical protein [Listeria kieliensis]|uniref:Metalloenzyme domain-containing protein n=1 Tax=Listeria kieliensis TaxID=1621700 RepID=A0A3D8TU24_9LIST|nr:hypothetical protein [Listeria kieliensis]RDX01326.1 hypothetical protein UR08_10430 [Listeria kieliensis]
MKVILLVLDALGVGQLENGNTYRTITGEKKELRELFLSQILDYSIEKVGNEEIVETVSKKFGLHTFFAYNLIPESSVPDSFLGHLEMIGNTAEIKEVYLEDEVAKLQKVLSKYGASKYEDGFLYIDNKIVIGNNAECSPGLNINVLAMKSDICVDLLTQISKEILEMTNCVRVIMMYGNDINLRQLYTDGLEKRKNIDGSVHTFLKIPPLQIYNDLYKVQHFGNKRLKPHLLDILSDSPKINRIELIGKVAKMFHYDATSVSEVYDGIETEKIFDALQNNLRRRDKNQEFIWTNVQKIDLFGHQQSITKSRFEYQIIANKVATTIEQLGQEDVLLITADHGNDPSVNGSFHTREKVPFAILSKNTVDLPNIQFTDKNLTVISDLVSYIFKLSEKGEVYEK